MRETGKIEFKSSTGKWKEIVETICAFADTDGGKINCSAKFKDLDNQKILPIEN